MTTDLDTPNPRTYRPTRRAYRPGRVGGAPACDYHSREGSPHNDASRKRWLAEQESRVQEMIARHAGHAGDESAAAKGRKGMATVQAQVVSKRSVKLFGGSVRVSLWEVAGGGWWWRNARWPNSRVRRKEGPHASYEAAVADAERLLREQPGLRCSSSEGGGE